MSAALTLHNPDGRAVDNPFRRYAIELLDRREILSSTAAGKLFVYGFTSLHGRGGVLKRNTRRELMDACDIHSEGALRKAIDKLCATGLVHRVETPGCKGAIALAFMTVPPPVAQQLLPGMEYEPPAMDVTEPTEAPEPEPSAPPERTESAHQECAPLVRTASAHGGGRGGSARSELRALTEKTLRRDREAERAHRNRARKSKAAERRERAVVTVDKVDVPAALSDPGARSALAEWLDYHRRIGKPYRDARYVNKLLADFASGGSAAFVAAVNHSIGNCYQGLFSPRKGPYQAAGTDADFEREVYENFKNR